MTMRGFAGATGYNLRWLLRWLQQAIADGRITQVYLRLYWPRLWAKLQAWRPDMAASLQMQLVF